MKEFNKLKYVVKLVILFISPLITFSKLVPFAPVGRRLSLAPVIIAFEARLYFRIRLGF